MYLVVGLGNPGEEYIHTKHNTGFIIIDKIAEKLGVKINKSKFNGLFVQTQISNEKVILLKPQTYMNLSGENIIQMVNFFKIPKENVIVIYDDIDFNIGDIRIRRSGTAGTHNGMKSVVNHLGTIDFPRIRIGINKEHFSETIDYVLSNYTKEEIDNLEKMSDNIYEIIVDIIQNNIEHSMGIYNKKKE